jgi:hypothetical protein
VNYRLKIFDFDNSEVMTLENKESNKETKKFAMEFVGYLNYVLPGTRSKLNQFFETNPTSLQIVQYFGKLSSLSLDIIPDEVYICNSILEEYSFS